MRACLVSLVHIGAILAQQLERLHVVLLRSDISGRAAVLNNERTRSQARKIEKEIR